MADEGGGAALGGDGRVRIEFPKRGGPRFGVGTRVFTASGDEVTQVRAIEISPILPDDLITAKIELHVELCDLLAHPLLGRESLEQAAAAYGLKLVPADEEAPRVAGPLAEHDAWVSALNVADEEAVGLIANRIALECQQLALSRGVTGKDVDCYLGLVFGVLEGYLGDLLRVVPVPAGRASDLLALQVEFCPVGYRRIAEAAKDKVANAID